MDVQKKLDEITEAVTNARSMPMSASCVVNRAELLAQLEEVRSALPGSLAEAQNLIGGREQMVAEARLEAERIVESAHAERGSLVSGTEVARHSQDEAERILAAARKEAEEVRAEADDYVDSKLANFEVVLTKTLGSVGRGRDKLLGGGPVLDQQGHEDPDYAEAPERSQDPETLRRRADEYVGVKLGAFEAVLAKTLEAVGRGRQKLHGRVAADELGTLDGIAADDHRHTSDADYLAGLADVDAAAAAPAAGPQPPQPAFVPPQQPAQPAYAPAEAAGVQAPPPAPEPAPYGTGQEAYAYGAQESYAYTAQGQQQDGYPEQYAQGGYPEPQQAQGGYPEPQQGHEGYAGDTWGGQQPSPYAPAYPEGQPAAYLPDGQNGYQEYSTGQVPAYGQDGSGGGYDPGGLPGSYGQEQAYGQQPGNHPGYGQQPAELDETSLFDTGMISAEQLRRYEQGL